MKFCLLALILLLCSCATKTGTGALVGAGLGAGIGAAAGGGGGAIIGGAVGAAAGGLVGNSLDAQDRERLSRDHPQTLQKVDDEKQLSIHDVINMSNAGVAPDTIIAMIKKTNSRFYLTSDEVIRLQKAGVDEKVVNYMVKN